jgi:hypothetical protein
MTKNRICDFFAVTMVIVTIAAATAIAQTQTFSVLHNFGTKSVDLDYPGYPGIIAQGRDGNLYSTGAAGEKVPVAFSKSLLRGPLPSCNPSTLRTGTLRKAG